MSSLKLQNKEKDEKEHINSIRRIPNLHAEPKGMAVLVYRFSCKTGTKVTLVVVYFLTKCALLHMIQKQNSPAMAYTFSVP